MVLMLDTTANHIGKVIAEELLGSAENAVEFELIDTAGMHISHCVGCNYCWLKTPGICAIQDDYEPILRKISVADQVWLVSDTHFGFVSWQTKNIVDRIMPLVTMYLKFKDGQMRHVMRYDHQPDIGIIYTGDGDQAYLERWCQRTALNLGSRSLGVFSESSRREAVSCML
ncbi:MAG: flavodoxin family protein [Lawsonibacter sp.]|nr:flavodoxin family protein [Lawsonibacter sp.]